MSLDHEFVIREIMWVNNSAYVNLPKYVVRRMGLEHMRKVKMKVIIGNYSFTLIPIIKGKTMKEIKEKKDKEVAEIVWAMNQYDNIRAMVLDMAKRQRD